MNKIIFPAFILILGACAAQVTAFTSEDVKRASDKFPGATETTLLRGKGLYEQNCGRCHSLYKPAMFNEQDWRIIVPGMAKKAKLEKHDEEAVLQYLVTFSEGFSK